MRQSGGTASAILDGVSTLSDLAVLVGVTIVFVAGAALIGYGVARYLARMACVSAAVAALPTGIFAIVLVNGGTAVFYSGRLSVIVPLACLVLAGGGLVAVLVDLRRARTLRPGGDLLAGAIAIGGACALHMWQIRAIFGFGTLATVSWNNDVLSYAYAARHLSDLGAGSAGWIIGYDAGAAARGDVLGAYGLLVPSATLVGDSMRATMPVMCVAVAAISAAVFVLLRQILGGGRVIPLFASLITIVGYPATYDAYQYFLSEKAAIAITLISLAGLIGLRCRVRIVLRQVLAIVAHACLSTGRAASGRCGSCGRGVVCRARHALQRVEDVVSRVVRPLRNGSRARMSGAVLAREDRACPLPSQSCRGMADADVIPSRVTGAA